MNWYLQSGKDSDVVTSTRIRFARNLQGFKFNLKNPKDIEELKNKIKENTYAIGYGLKYLELKDMDAVFSTMSEYEEIFVNKALEILKKHSDGLGQTELLNQIGYEKTDKTARDTLDKFTDKFWSKFQEKKGKPITYTLI